MIFNDLIMVTEPSNPTCLWQTSHVAAFWEWRARWHVQPPFAETHNLALVDTKNCVHTPLGQLGKVPIRAETAVCENNIAR